jgi:hypothetical protein
MLLGGKGETPRYFSSSLGDLFSKPTMAIDGDDESKTSIDKNPISPSIMA